MQYRNVRTLRSVDRTISHSCCEGIPNGHSHGKDSSWPAGGNAVPETGGGHDVILASTVFGRVGLWGIEVHFWHTC